MQDLNWNDLRYVLAIGRSDSLAMAGRKLGVNESTVARRLTGIEGLLNTRLFERGYSSLTPTEAGISSIQVAECIELQTQELVSRVSGVDQGISGSVRLTSVPVILNRLVSPALPNLLSEHPNLNIQLVSDSRNLSLTKRDADIAIRLARPTKESRVIARRIGNLDYAVYGKKKSREPLLWINYEEGMSHLPQFHWLANQIKKSECPSQVTVNDAESILACIKSGAGKSLLPIFVGDSEAGITRVSQEIMLSREVWLLVHPDLKDFGRIRTVMNWLTSLLEKL